MKKLIFTLFAYSVCSISYTQNIDAFFIGDTADVSPTPTRGVVWMGGRGEDDNAMKWFLNRANGGDIVVLRTSGGAGYQNYMYNELGVQVNSVRTFVLKNRNHSFDAEVIKYLIRAEAVWIAGGNQATYVQFWKDTPIDSLINYLHQVKGAPVGGISAGLAVLSHFYFTALNGTVESDEALLNPFISKLNIGRSDFLKPIHSERLINDSHYNDPDRRGRHVAFLARLYQEEGGTPIMGIGVNEYVAVCVNDSGIARVFGEFPKHQDDLAYFVRLGCEANTSPEVLNSGSPLTWNRNQKALKVFVAQGREDGSTTLDLNDWKTTNGNGTWQDWWVDMGQLQVQNNAQAPVCAALNTNAFESIDFQLYPNPAQDFIHVSLSIDTDFYISDAQGRALINGNLFEGENRIDVSNLKSGFYFIIIGAKSHPWIKK